MGLSKDLVRRSYDEQAGIYASRKLLQTTNLKRLLLHLFTKSSVPASGTLLDVGCGDGVLLDVLNEDYKQIPYEYHGIDLSAGMIQAAKESHVNSIPFEVGDAEDLPVASDSIDIVISNSVLHWLNVPCEAQTPMNAVAEIRRVLKKGGKAAVSISGVGTATRFLKAYIEIRQESGQTSSEIRPDPIGSMHLHEVVDMFMQCELSIDVAQIEYEPAIYPSPEKYADHVKAYGFEMFLAGVADEEKERTWKRISKRFQDNCGNGEYTHDQYMCYLVATK